MRCWRCTKGTSRELENRCTCTDSDSKNSSITEVIRSILFRGADRKKRHMLMSKEIQHFGDTVNMVKGESRQLTKYADAYIVLRNDNRVKRQSGG